MDADSTFVSAPEGYAFKDSVVYVPVPAMDTLLAAVLHRLSGHADGPLLSRSEAEEFLRLPSSSTLDMLSVAGVVRAARAPAFFNCGILNAKSGRCPENCAFCAQSAHHETGAPVYPFVSTDVIVQKAAEAAGHGVRRFSLVVSGTMLDEKDVEPLCRAVERIIAETGMSVCGSLGILTPERAVCYRQAGVTRSADGSSSSTALAWDQRCSA